jgi:hypothetical protein
MGRQEVYITQRGTDMRDAFRTAQREAEEEHGHEQGYSGHINSSELRGDYTAEYFAAKKKGKAALDKLIEEWQEKCNSDVFGVCLEPPKPNKNKVKTKVTITPQKGAKKWETLYIGYTGFDESQVCSGKTQGECVKKARQYSDTHKCTVRLGITKVLTKGSSNIGKVEYKPAKGESLGKYLFIGDARS